MSNADALEQFELRKTDRLHLVVKLARLESIKLGHRAVEPIHLLFGLAGERGSLPARFLRESCGIKIDTLHEVLEQINPSGAMSLRCSDMYSKQARMIVVGAVGEAGGDSSIGYITTEHLFVSLLCHESPELIKVFRAFGLQMDVVKEDFEDVQGNEMQPFCVTIS